MKKIINSLSIETIRIINVLFYIAIVCAFTCLAASGAEVLTPAQQSFMNGRLIVTGRDTTSITGSVITTWSRNGRVERVYTNQLKRITGVKQNNPLQGLYVAATNAAAIRQAKIDNFVKHLEEKRDEAKLSTTKAIYNALIEKLGGD